MAVVRPLSAALGGRKFRDPEASDAAARRTSSSSLGNWKAKPRPTSAIASNRTQDEQFIEGKTLVKEIFELCEALDTSEDFVAALQRNFQVSGLKDVDMLRQCRDSLLRHRSATLAVLRRIEARERVLGCIHHFLQENQNAGSLSPPQHAAGEAMLETLVTCSTAVEDALAQWETSVRIVCRDDAVSARTADFRWKGMNYLHKMHEETSRLDYVREAWHQSSVSPTPARSTGTSSEEPLHVSSASEPILHAAALQIQKIYRGHSQWLSYRYEKAKANAARRIQIMAKCRLNRKLFQRSRQVRIVQTHCRFIQAIAVTTRRNWCNSLAIVQLFCAAAISSRLAHFQQVRKRSGEAVVGFLRTSLRTKKRRQRRQSKEEASSRISSWYRRRSFRHSLDLTSTRQRRDSVEKHVDATTEVTTSVPATVFQEVCPLQIIWTPCGLIQQPLPLAPEVEPQPTKTSTDARRCGEPIRKIDDLLVSMSSTAAVPLEVNSRSSPQPPPASRYRCPAAKPVHRTKFAFDENDVRALGGDDELLWEGDTEPACVIQRAFRGFKAKCECSALKQEREVLLQQIVAKKVRESALQLIQNCCRGFAARCRITLLPHPKVVAVQAIQGWWRTCVARRPPPTSCVSFRGFDPEVIAELFCKKKSAVKIASWYHYIGKRRRWAVKVLTRAWKNFLCLRDYHNRLAAKRFHSAEEKRKRQLRREELFAREINESVLLVQLVIRQKRFREIVAHIQAQNYAVQLEILRQRNAAIAVQCAWRCCCARKKKSLLLFSAIERRKLLREHEKEVDAIETIQSCARCRLSSQLRELQRLRQIYRTQRNAARVIQRTLRKWVLICQHMDDTMAVEATSMYRALQLARIRAELRRSKPRRRDSHPTS